MQTTERKMNRAAAATGGAVYRRPITVFSPPMMDKMNIAGQRLR